MLFRHWRHFRAMPRSVLHVSLLAGILILIEGVLWYLLPPHFERTVGLSAAGIILASYGIAAFVTELPIGDIADKIDRKFAFSLGVLVFLGSLLLLFVASSFWVLFLFMCLLGIASTLINIGSINTVMDLGKKRNAGKVVGVYETFQAFGWCFGSIFAGIGLYFLPLPTLVKFLMAFLLVLLAWTVRHYPGKSTLRVSDFFKSLLVMKRDRVYLRELRDLRYLGLPLLAFIAYSFAFGFYEYAMWMSEPIYISFTGANIILGGLVLSLINLPHLFLSYWTGSITDRIGGRNLVIGGILLLVLGHLFFLFSSHNLGALTITFLILAIADVLIIIPFTAYLRGTVKKSLRGELMGSSGALYDFAGIVAPLVVVAISSVIDFRKIFILTLLVFIVPISLLTAILFRDPKGFQNLPVRSSFSGHKKKRI